MYVPSLAALAALSLLLGKLFHEINTIKLGFILIISLYLKISQKTMQLYKSRPALIVSLPSLITPQPCLVVFAPLLANIFPNKFVPNIPSNISRKPPQYSFVLFLIVLVIPFINKPESSRD